ncbi:MAG: glutamate-5-semialdehyde dehydrogenase [Pseudomonadota bacterium]
MLNRSEMTDAELAAMMEVLGANARAAAHSLSTASAETKDKALSAMADAIIASSDDIIAANEIDMKNAREAGISGSFLDRLALNPDRVASMANGVRAIAELDDPVGDVIAAWDRPNGLQIERVRTPLGVVGVIYESRPNVTADAGALCLKAGNAVILRGGSDSVNSSAAIHEALIAGLKEAGLPETAIQIVPTTDRRAVGQMLGGLSGNIDVIVPRGGKSLVGRVQTEARVPVFAHLEGLCHLYVDASSNVEMTVPLVLNSKLRRTGICGAAETLLIDQAAIKTHALPILEALAAEGCEIRADETIRSIYVDASPASEDDWATEYLAPIISVSAVDGIDGAVAHITRWSSNHTEAVFAEDATVVETFFANVDSAILLHNASTQFADGGEFGMGAEIGIATGKMHARGPVGVEQLTSFKYRVRGSGQIRPL